MFRTIWIATTISIILLTGCTTSLTNMAPARTMKPGEGQVAMGYHIDVHTQTFTGVYKAGDAAINQV
ncbi:MAG: hypothetical protein ACNA8W_25175, partial [Bradymonadaceae bacterium]